MSRHASLRKNETSAKKQQAPVIPIQGHGDKSKKQGMDVKEKSNKDLPMFNSERIFKVKKHDPL
jgi:hypothetical protein